LTGLVKDNETELAPTLERLNRVTQVLERNRDNIATRMPPEQIAEAQALARACAQGYPQASA